MVPLFATSRVSVGPVLKVLTALASDGPMRPLGLSLLAQLWEKHVRVYPELLQAVIAVPRFGKIQDGLNDQVRLRVILHVCMWGLCVFR